MLSQCCWHHVLCKTHVEEGKGDRGERTLHVMGTVMTHGGEEGGGGSVSFAVIST